MQANENSSFEAHRESRGHLPGTSNSQSSPDIMKNSKSSGCCPHTTSHLMDEILFSHSCFLCFDPKEFRSNDPTYPTRRTIARQRCPHTGIHHRAFRAHAGTWIKETKLRRSSGIIYASSCSRMTISTSSPKSVSLVCDALPLIWRKLGSRWQVRLLLSREERWRDSGDESLPPRR